MSTVTVRDAVAGDFAALVIENEFIAATLVPERGADLVDLIDRQRELPVLWHSPSWGRSPGRWPGAGGEDFFNHYPGGMQEVFPNGGPSCSYEGAELGFHGEACKVPWSFEISEEHDRAEVVCTTRLSRLPFAMRKTFSLGASDRALRIDAEIRNEGRRDLRYMWGFHPAFGLPLLGEHTVVHAPARRLRVHAEPSGVGQQLTPGTSHEWPLAEGVDRSVLLPPSASSSDLWYLDGFTAGWYVIENPDLDLMATMSWEAARFPYLWLWQQCHEDTGRPWFGAQHVVALEPWTSYPSSGLSAAIENGSAAAIGAGETHVSRLGIGITARAGEDGTPTGVDPVGGVIYGRSR